MNDDLNELLASLNSHHVRYLVIGAHALAFHGHPRLTGDVDLWVERSSANSDCLRQALEAFGAGIGDGGARRFATNDRQMIRLGVPPQMVDILNFAGNESFDEVWASSMEGELGGVPVRFPSKDHLRLMKQASGRPQDLADIDRLRE